MKKTILDLFNLIAIHSAILNLRYNCRKIKKQVGICLKSLLASTLNFYSIMPNRCFNLNTRSTEVSSAASL